MAISFGLWSEPVIDRSLDQVTHQQLLLMNLFIQATLFMVLSMKDVLLLYNRVPSLPFIYSWSISKVQYGWNDMTWPSNS